MSHFERDGEYFDLHLTHDEADILINLVEQLLELLGEGDFFHHFNNADPLAQLLAMPDEITTPDDPVLMRLLPNAYADPEAASDFRRYTEPALRGAKQRSLRQVREDLLVLVDANTSEERGADGRQVTSKLAEIDAQAWLKSLNDLRLALGIRLDIDPEAYDKYDLISDDDPIKPTYAVYFWLGWLQGNLLELLTKSEPA
jgi:hypothetical protein